MALWFHPRTAEGYLYVVGEGPVVTEDVANSVDEAVNLIIDLELPGALVDFSLATLEMSIVDISKLPDWFETRNLPQWTRIAVVLPADPANMHKYIFFDDVSTNRGYQVRLFWEPTSAVGWLNESA
ncbi:MAG TPA: hypothetical protein VLV87_02850 [Gammaproteobacteria bacterium]|nr:hypothetical protein [Gammaproteobacteria bacterium]